MMNRVALAMPSSDLPRRLLADLAADPPQGTAIVLLFHRLLLQKIWCRFWCRLSIENHRNWSNWTESRKRAKPLCDKEKSLILLVFWIVL
jgi:hypothetical protein